MKFLTLDLRSKLVLITASLAVTLYVQRPDLNLNPFWSVIYFMPAYLIGMTVSEHLAAAQALMYRWRWPLVAAIFGLAAYQVGIVEQVGNYHKVDILAYNGLDLIILQKLAMCLLFVGLMPQLESWQHPQLKLLAESSFAIFFLHGFAIMFVQFFIKDALPIWPHWAGVALLFTLAMSLSFIAALAVRRVAGSYSRRLIGW